MSFADRVPPNDLEEAYRLLLASREGRLYQRRGRIVIGNDPVPPVMRVYHWLGDHGLVWGPSAMNGECAIRPGGEVALEELDQHFETRAA